MEEKMKNRKLRPLLKNNKRIRFTMTATVLAVVGSLTMFFAGLIKSAKADANVEHNAARVEEVTKINLFTQFSKGEITYEELKDKVGEVEAMSAREVLENVALEGQDVLDKAEKEKLIAGMLCAGGALTMMAGVGVNVNKEESESEDE